MTSKLLALAGLALLLATPAFPKSNFDADAFAKEVAKAETGDPTVDYLWLRKQASAQLGYVEKNWEDWRQADQLVDTDPEKSLQMARARMAVMWTDFLPHIVAQLALDKLGKHEEADRERKISGSISRSIGGGHKGTSDTDAFNAVSVAEEYRTLSLLRWASEQQSLVHKNGHSFDVFDVVDLRTKEKRQAWFNIDAFYGKEFAR